MRYWVLLAWFCSGLAFAAVTGKATKGDAKKPVAQNQPQSEATVEISPAVISAKAVLEEFLARRYSQGVASLIDRKFFNLGAELELSEKPKAESKNEKKKDGSREWNENSLPEDLMLGNLNLDDVMQETANPEIKEELDQLLSRYQIKTVQISLGISSTLGNEVKEKAAAYLANRVKAEFSTLGKSQVSFMSNPADQPKTWLDQVNQFQGLLGQLFMALAILLGVSLWSFTTKKQKIDETQQTTGERKLNHSGMTDQRGGGNGSVEVKGAGGVAAGGVGRADGADGKTSQEIAEYGKRLAALVPKLTREYDGIIRFWCQAGEEGILKLACFAEAMGGELGKLPIPVDSKKELSTAFGKMPEITEAEKKHILSKVYWDLMMAINLGLEALDRPFGYLSSVKSSMLGKVLVDQNPKMKTLVTLFMPESERAVYLSNQNDESKLELLKTSLDLSEIATEELRAQEAKLKLSLGGGVNQRKDTVVIDSAFLKIVNALSATDVLSLVPKMEGEQIELFKRSNPTLAFIHEWNPEFLARLLAQVSPDELVAYLRIMPDYKDQMLSYCPPMTAEVVQDDLARPDKLAKNERNRLLTEFTKRIKAMVDAREVNLETVFDSNNEEPRMAA